MAQRVKLYEAKKAKRALPLWGWVLGIVLVVALIVFLFTRRNSDPATAPVITPAAWLSFPAFAITLPETSAA